MVEVKDLCLRRKNNEVKKLWWLREEKHSGILGNLDLAEEFLRNKRHSRVRLVAEVRDLRYLRVEDLLLILGKIWDQELAVVKNWYLKKV